MRRVTSVAAIFTGLFLGIYGLCAALGDKLQMPRLVLTLSLALPAAGWLSFSLFAKRSERQ